MIIIIIIINSLGIILTEGKKNNNNNISVCDAVVVTARIHPAYKMNAVSGRNQLSWAVSPPLGCCHPHRPSPFIIINHPKADTSERWKVECRRLVFVTTANVIVSGS